MAWFEVYERDVNGAPGEPWPTRPRIAPAEPPETLELAEHPATQIGTTLLGSLLGVIRDAVAVVRR